jgi:hypothetical protein
MRGKERVAFTGKCPKCGSDEFVKYGCTNPKISPARIRCKNKDWAKVWYYDTDDINLLGKNESLKSWLRSREERGDLGLIGKNVKKNGNEGPLFDKTLQRKVLSKIEEMKPEIPVHKYYGDLVRIGVVGDTHLGSIYENVNLLKVAYDLFKEEGIATVYHTGDMCDGENMFSGHYMEIHTHGGDAQVKYCADVYPKIEGITTYFITGSHDLSFYKRAGMDIGNHIAARRKDLIYLGRERKDVKIHTENGGDVILRVVHPGGGTAYALSYKPQKMLDALSGGQKPNIMLVGHFHKAEYLPCYRNVFTIQSGTIQSQTGFMERNSLAAHIGFWILEFRVNGNEVTSLKADFKAHYEGRIISADIQV